MFHQVNQKADSTIRFPDCLLLILAVFTGTFFVYRDFGFRMILGFGALCLILLLQLLQRVQQNRPPVTQAMQLPFLMLAAVILLSFLRPASRHDVDSGSYLISMLICCGFVYLAAPTAAECRRTLKTLFLCGMALAVFVVFFSIFEELFFDTLFHILSPTAQEYLLFFVPGGYAITLGGCTYTCYLMFFGMAACCGYVCSETWGKKSMLMLLACGFLLFALLLVGRRGELLGAVVCLAVLFFAMCPPRRRRLLLAASIVLGAAMLGLVMLFLPQLKEISFLERYILTIENLLSGNDVTSGRLTLYQIAFRAFRENPILGIGWDQFQTLIPEGYLTDPVVGIEDTHCIYLQFLCETGIVGTPLIVAPLLYYYFQVCTQFRRLKYRRGESPELRLAFNLTVNSFLLQSFLLFVGIYDPNFQRIIFWCFYALSILMLTAAMDLAGHHPADPVSRLLERLLPAPRKRGQT